MNIIIFLIGYIQLEKHNLFRYKPVSTILKRGVGLLLARRSKQQLFTLKVNRKI